MEKKSTLKKLIKKKLIVATTGKGVEDVQALKQAHVGIGLGISGTDISKNAADIILQDDDFSTIVDAVEEGRSIYQNMKALICFTISSNIGEVLTIFISSIIGIPDPFSPIQLLWICVITKGLPSIALYSSFCDPDVMTKPPRNT